MNSLHDVKRQLNRILRSQQFKSSHVLTEFLKYVVNETLELRGRELKEYTIATAVLNKETGFDPQQDSIVRIHAGRLRRALNEYYHEEGVNDPIRVSIPKGCYVPVFEPHIATTTSEHSGEEVPAKGNIVALKNMATNLSESFLQVKKKPAVIVLPFELQDETSELRYIHEYLSIEFTRLEDIKTLSYQFHQPLIQSSTPSVIDVDYIVSGVIQNTGDGVRIIFELVSKSGELLWGDTHYQSRKELNKNLLVKQIVSSTHDALIKLCNGISETNNGSPVIAIGNHR